jgi:hypothetical protein
MHALGVVALALDDLPAARWWGEALYEQEKAGAAYLAWHAQEILMHAALAAGESCVAHEHSKLLAEHAQQLGNRRGLAIAQRGMARVLMMGDDDSGAGRWRIPRLRSSSATAGGWRRSPPEVVAAIAARTSRAEQAARLFAAAAAREALGVAGTG